MSTTIHNPRPTFYLCLCQENGWIVSYLYHYSTDGEWQPSCVAFQSAYFSWLSFVGMFHDLPCISEYKVTNQSPIFPETNLIDRGMKLCLRQCDHRTINFRIKSLPFTSKFLNDRRYSLQPTRIFFTHPDFLLQSVSDRIEAHPSGCSLRPLTLNVFNGIWVVVTGSVGRDSRKLLLQEITSRTWRAPQSLSRRLAQLAPCTLRE